MRSGSERIQKMLSAWASAMMPTVTVMPTEQDNAADIGIRKIEDRIEAIKRMRQRLKLLKIFGKSLVITGVVLSGLVYLTHQPGASSTIANAGTGANPYAIVLKDHMVFEGVQIDDIINILEHEYDLSFQTRDNDILSLKFTGTFSSGTPIEEMIRVLGQSGNFMYMTLGPRSFELRAIDAEGDQNNAVHH